MTEERFDLSYRGDLLAGADPAVVRQHLRAVFNLSEESAARLFTGRSVSIKHNADAETAVRFRDVFTQAGALLRVSPIETVSDADDRTDVRSSPQPSRAQNDASAPAATPLSLAAHGGFLEAPPTINIDAFDTSELSLVVGSDWSLADCEPAPASIPLPDIGHLSLAEMEPPSNTDKPAD